MDQRLLFVPLLRIYTAHAWMLSVFAAEKPYTLYLILRSEE